MKMIERIREQHEKFQEIHPEFFPIPSNPQAEMFGLSDVDLKQWAHIGLKDLNKIEPVSRFWLLADSYQARETWQKEKKQKVKYTAPNDFLAEIVEKDLQAEEDWVHFNYSI